MPASPKWSPKKKFRVIFTIALKVFRLMSHRYETARDDIPLLIRYFANSTPGASENRSRVFQGNDGCALDYPGRVISGNCRTLWASASCLLPVRRCECRWLEILQTLALLAVAMRWSRRARADVRALQECIGLSRLSWSGSAPGPQRTSLAYKDARSLGSLAPPAVTTSGKRANLYLSSDRPS